MQTKIQTACLSLLALLWLVASHGCEQIQVAADSLRLLSFNYDFYPARSSADSIRSRLGDIASLEAGELFLLEDPSSNSNLSHTRIFGSLSGVASLRILRFNPGSSRNNDVTGLDINLRGNLSEGTVYQPARADFFVGDRSTSSQTYGITGDSFFELEIARLDTVNRVIAGSFQGVLRNQDDPNGQDVLVIQDGTFRQTYQLRN